MARLAALSSKETPLDWITRTAGSRVPSARMANRTVTGWLKSPRICWVQIIQIFRCTPARYQSPEGAGPPGTPGPPGPALSRPGNCDEAVVVGRAVVEAGALVREGGVFSGFFLARLASGSGSPFFGSSLGGLTTLGGGSGWGAGGCSGAGFGATGAGGGPLGPPPPGGSAISLPSMTWSTGCRGRSM